MPSAPIPASPSAARALPSLLALRAFEAAARLLSFSLAAQELCITQSAVSHHIRRLETELGAALFERRVRAVALTASGAAYYQQVRAAFELLREGTAAIRAQPARDALTLSLLPAFAAHWLAPRLQDFAAAHPRIGLQLRPDTAPADIAGGQADAAIRYGRGGWPGVDARRFLPERLAVVCAPALRGLSRSELLRRPLLASSWPSFEWQAWARRTGASLDGARPVDLGDYNIVLEAAQAGQGIAIGRRCLIGRQLASGALLKPLDEPWVETADIGWWLLTRRPDASPAARAFRDWLLQTAAATDELNSSMRGDN